MPHLPEPVNKRFSVSSSAVDDGPQSATRQSQEHEAVQPSSSELEALGITRLLTEKYIVGEYTYTKLADAMAQARRVTLRAGS